jgi:hypothetical protein
LTVSVLDKLKKYLDKNVGENRSENNKWTVQRHEQHWTQYTKRATSKAKNTMQKTKLVAVVG